MPTGKFIALFFSPLRWYAELDKEEQCHRVCKVARSAKQMFCTSATGYFRDSFVGTSPPISRLQLAYHLPYK